ncbi:MAG: radical SAM protein [Actinomycetota bacterium]
MRICLIRPGRKESELSFEKGEGWEPIRSVFNKVSRWKTGTGNGIPSLALTMLAALTPPDSEITVVDEDIQEIDFDQSVDLVGITLLTVTALRSYDIADRFRERGVKVVLGGMHATVRPEEAAQHADAVVIGEAEGVWHQVLADAKAGKLQRFYRSRTFSNMQRMPIPRRDLLCKQSYVTTNTLQATRGCPNHCSFCSIHAVAGRSYRCRPIPEVVSEIETFSDRAAVFVDDNIVGNPTYAKQLFRALIPKNIWWFGQATLTIAADDELLDLAAKSGCKCLLIGFESLSEENIRRIGKTRTNKVSDYKEAVKKLHAHGISVAGSFILGLDNDDTSVFDRTIEFILSNNIDIPNVCVLTPYPGTDLFRKLEREDRIIHKDWRHYGGAYDAVVFRPKLMTATELEQGYRFVDQQIYALRATTKRLFGAMSKISPIIALPIMAFNLKKRKVLRAKLKRVRACSRLDRATNSKSDKGSPG